MTGISNPIFRSCGNKSVSIPKIRQQAKYIVIQKIYFANTISFRGNGSAHNKVDALGYCVSFKDTYCKSIKIEKIVIKTKHNMPAYSGERHIKNIGKITHTANIISTYFLTIKKSFFTNCISILLSSFNITKHNILYCWAFNDNVWYLLFYFISMFRNCGKPKRSFINIQKQLLGI